MFMSEHPLIVNEGSALWQAWYIYKIVAHFTMCTYGVKQIFRFVEGIWLHRKNHQMIMIVDSNVIMNATFNFNQ